jgi:nicotinamide mononucleotide transporter PnuC
MKKFLRYFTPLEWVLWLGGMAVIFVGFFLSSQKSLLSLFSSLAGITCVIFNAKGNVAGQIIAIMFAVLYGLYAYTQHYYGEMLIYFCLMIPIHIFSVISWLRHRFGGKIAEVEINRVSRKEYVLTAICAVPLTVGFYFLLRALHTDNLVVSTISLVTSLAAAYFMLRRCELFALCFIANDIVLIVLWGMKLATVGLSVLPSVLCFVVFLFCDGYSFISWRRIKRRQSQTSQSTQTTKPSQSASHPAS